MMMRRKIYVASSWRNGYYPEVVEKLREAGHEVYDLTCLDIRRLSDSSITTSRRWKAATPVCWCYPAAGVPIRRRDGLQAKGA